MGIFTGSFWLAALERALWTISEVAFGMITIGTVGFGDIDWLYVASVAGVAGVASVLKSIVVAGATDGSPSVATEVIDNS